MYLGIPPFGQTVRTISEKIAIQDQVDFYPDGGYLPGYIDIDMNGQGLLSSDVIATDGIKVTLKVKANALDEFRSVAYWPVSLVDTYRKSEADAKFATPSSVTPGGISDKANTSTGYMAMPVGNNAQRPVTPASGMYRMNSQNNTPEWYDPVAAAWIPFSSLSVYNVDTLAVAGGGGGAGANGGGGGAGGMAVLNSGVVAGTSYTITIGAGGSGSGNTVGVRGGNGSNTTSGGITAIGGGGGASFNNSAWPGASGGSGGGGGGLDAAGAGNNGGSGTSGQGNTGGGGGRNNTQNSGGGGGGAGAIGGTASASNAGGGGAGLSWYNGATYAGGGGGGSNGASGASGGSGGGGAGVLNGTGGAGSANTGGGAGGGTTAGGTGGSGIVVVRYPGGQRGTGGVVTSSGGFTFHTFTSSGTFTA